MRSKHDRSNPGQPSKWTRRKLLSAAAAVPAVASVASAAPETTSGEAAAAGADAAVVEPVSKVYGHDSIYTKLFGIRPIVKCRCHTTVWGGSRMPAEVMRAMLEANEYFVDMYELFEAAGKRIAEVMGAEAAMVTAGGSSALTLGAAACLTGTDPDKVRAVPNVTWARRECLIHKAHRDAYDRAFASAGMVTREFESRQELVNAIGDETAMLSALAGTEHRPGPPNMVTVQEILEIGKKGGIPTLVDAADEIPPENSLTRYTKMGFDLVVFSGGKGLLGPQSTGILAGRKDLIAAAAMNGFPNTALGRGMKVGKEAVVGLVTAIDLYVSQDHDLVHETWNKKARYIADQLQGVPGLQVEYRLTDHVREHAFTDVRVRWDRQVLPLTGKQVDERLRAGEPRVVVELIPARQPSGDSEGFTIYTRNMRDGEEILAARRLKQFFQSEAKRGA
jgi:L-seryl-tRNA(Ser) seleniumtransferase